MHLVLAIITGAAVIAAALCVLYMIGWPVAKFILKEPGKIDAFMGIVIGTCFLMLSAMAIGFVAAIGNDVLHGLQ